MKQKQKVKAKPIYRKDIGNAVKVYLSTKGITINDFIPENYIMPSIQAIVLPHCQLNKVSYNRLVFCIDYIDIKGNKKCSYDIPDKIIQYLKEINIFKIDSYFYISQQVRDKLLTLYDLYKEREKSILNIK